MTVRSSFAANFSSLF